MSATFTASVLLGSATDFRVIRRELVLIDILTVMLVLAAAASVGVV